MNLIERQIIKSLQYLLWTHQPKSETSEERRDKLMVENHLLLNPISADEDCCDMGEDNDTPNEEDMRELKKIKDLFALEEKQE